MTFGEFWTSLEERSRHFVAAPCRWLPARTRSRVEVFQKTVKIMTEHSGHINGETMVPLYLIFSSEESMESKIRAIMLSVVHFLFLGISKVLVWHHCHHVFANFWTRQSRPSLFFPRGSTLSAVTTIACCPYLCAKATFTTADGKVAKSASSYALRHSRCFDTSLMVSMKVCSHPLLL